MSVKHVMTTWGPGVELTARTLEEFVRLVQKAIREKREDVMIFFIADKAQDRCCNKLFCPCLSNYRYEYEAYNGLTYVGNDISGYLIYGAVEKSDEVYKLIYG